ncbi:MAG: FCD domain protein [Chloroflexi bacterium ADurb.Bin325]|nr:MAG: FCD domain protein [Chloroflexi bacterium ADurb.Bin325]
MILSHLDSEFLRYLLAHGCQPGERLPSLDEISAEVGISVGKLREQFEVARVLGLVEASPRRGIRCLPYDFRPTVRLGLMIALGLDQDAFRAYSALRIHLETAFWDEAIVLLTDEDKVGLCQLVERAHVKLAEPRIQIPYEEHRAFHLGIFRRIENPFVLGLLEAYWDAYEAVELNTYADYTYLQEVWGYHARIAEAIRDGNYAQGKELLIQHMRLLDKMGVAHELSVSVTELQGEAI